MFNINYQTGLFLAFVFGLLIFASVYIYLKRDALKNYTELKNRTLSWWVIIIVTSLALISYFYISILFFATLSLISLREYFKITPTRKSDYIPIGFAFLAIVIQYYFIATFWYGMFIIFIPVYMFFFIAAIMVITGNVSDFLKAISIIQWGMMIAIFNISHLAYLLVLPMQQYNFDISYSTSLGAGLFFYILFTTQFNDVAQYIWGKKLGKYKIIPKVSPNKTWAGFLGGMLTTTIISIILGLWLTPMSLPFATLMGVLISIAGFFGDVTISAIKRDLGIKDTGTLLPGHGGILDRIDSLTFTAPLFFHLLRYFYY
ncbi:MAG: phosphatidate cytidylyltransferase [Alphaproteobacteria bacterium]